MNRGYAPLPWSKWPKQDTFECKNAAVDLYGESFKPVTDLNEMLRVSHNDETLPLSEPNYQWLGKIHLPVFWFQAVVLWGINGILMGY